MFKAAFVSTWGMQRAEQTIKIVHVIAFAYKKWSTGLVERLVANGTRFVGCRTGGYRVSGTAVCAVDIHARRSGEHAVVEFTVECEMTD